jgi:hypothetical protein
VTAREILRRIALWGGVGLYFCAVIADALHGDETGLVAYSAFPVVGAIILMSRPRNGIGWYLYAVGIIWILGSNTTTRLVGDEQLWSAIASTALANFFWPAVPLVGVLFPLGRPVGRRGRMLFWGLLGVAALNGLSQIVAPTVWWTDIEIPNPLGTQTPPLLWTSVGATLATAMVAIILGIVVDVALRWRRSTGIARQQFKWFGFGLIGGLVLYLGVGLSANLLVDVIDPVGYELVVIAALLTIELVPISIGIAVTRHGLFDIARVISRTVSYAIVTLVVIGVYALVVVSLTRLLPDLPSVGVALATLIAAAVFLPVLRGVQRRVDRRFDRERYDAEKVVDAFGERLRTDLDPHATSGELREAIEKTLQPASIGLWTSGGPR